MRVYVGVQPTPSGGASSLSSYIAKSKVDREREQLTESGSRRLFSADKESLTLKEADHVLNPTERELQKDELIHVVISPEPGALDRAGDDPVEKHKAIRQAIRGTLRVMAEVVNVKNLFWIAGIHENTKTPHVHVAISRWALDAVTNKLRYIKHLPKSLLPHNTEDAGGERRFLVGKIAEVFTSSFVRLLKPIRSVQLRDTQNNINVSRSVLSRFAQMLQHPTSDQVIVGQWLETALMLATDRTGQLSRDELLQQHTQLTAEVTKIDAIARGNGVRPPAAFIPVERLETLVNSKVANVQITVSSPELKPDEERLVTLDATEKTVGSNSAEAPTQLVETPPLVTASGVQTETRNNLKESQKLTPSRATSHEHQERTEHTHKEDLKVQQPVKEATTEPQEPERVAKLTLPELRDQIDNGNLTLPLTQIISSTENSNTSVQPGTDPEREESSQSAVIGLQGETNGPVVTKTGDGESKVGAPVQAQTIAPQEWQLDDGDIKKFAAIAYHHFADTLRTLGMDNVLIENGDYFSPHVTRAEAQLREAQIAFKISLDACLERRVKPDLDGLNKYLITEIRLGHGSQVALMEQMNIVRDSLEDITSPANHRLFEEYERLHNLYPELRPKFEHGDLYQTRERSHERTDRARELDHEIHEHSLI